LLLQEIKEAIVGVEILEEEAMSFGISVLDRFTNPFLEHRWESISAQYALKMNGRCIPLITDYWKKFSLLPNHMLLGLSAFLIWDHKDSRQLSSILSDREMWETDLGLIPGLKDQVFIFMKSIELNGVRRTINMLVS